MLVTCQDNYDCETDANMKGKRMLCVKNKKSSISRWCPWYSMYLDCGYLILGIFSILCTWCCIGKINSQSVSTKGTKKARSMYGTTDEYYQCLAQLWLWRKVSNCNFCFVKDLNLKLSSEVDYSNVRGWVSILEHLNMVSKFFIQIIFYNVNLQNYFILLKC